MFLFFWRGDLGFLGGGGVMKLPQEIAGINCGSGELGQGSIQILLE